MKPSFPSNESTLSPYSAQVLDTLRNILAPGKRFKISPFIESAQFFCLFGEAPPPEARNQQMHDIFRRYNARMEELAENHSQFVSGQKKFTGSYDKAFLDRYMIYYFPVNVAKLQLMMLELVEKETIDSEIQVMDIGVGSGTSALAIFDFFLAWAIVCNLYDIKFPIVSVEYAGIDNSEFCLDFAAKAVAAFAESLKKRDEKTVNPICRKILEWLRNCKWIKENVNTGASKIIVENRQTILTASNVLNELRPEGKQRIETLIGNMPDDSYAIIIEPGDRNKTIKLNSWRKNLQQKNKQVKTLAPCGQEYDDFSECHCDSCWNARRESIFQSPLYRAFREKCSHYITDKRLQSFDEFENDLLSWSYYILKKVANQKAKPPEESLKNDIKRFIGTFANKSPVSLSNDGTAFSSLKEFLKFCPGIGSKCQNLVIERKPGMQCQDLRHGENVVFSKIMDAPQLNWANNVAIQYNLDEEAMLELRPIRRSPDQSGFLKNYSSLVQIAVDDIAFRLFGFPGMYPFQHRILARVLQGRSILGIAATGGGKSECYILPAMLLPGITIVIAPLISLIQDQYEQRIKDRYGLEGVATFINSEIGFQEKQARLKRITLGYYKIVYLTPEQLEKSNILNCLQEADRKHTIRYLALDESHCISQWGHDFRPAYLNMVNRLKLWKINPIRIALTATASPEVRQDLCVELGLNPEPIEKGGDVFLHSSNRYELNLVAKVFPEMTEKSRAILDALKQLTIENKRTNNNGTAIVFLPYTGGSPESSYFYMPGGNENKKLASQKGMLSAGVTPFASYVERKMQQRVSIYHGKMENDSPKNQSWNGNVEYGDLRGRSRKGEQKSFINGDTDIMIATKGFGMGIDKPNIRLVIHRTPTSNLEAYAQESGRAGRDGDIANCLLFYSPESQEKTDEHPSRIPSDHEIQTRFLSDKYIKKNDMVVMYNFMRSLTRRVGDHLYFTNDEAVDFFDICVKKPEPVGLSNYSWPEFQEREIGPYENDEEKHCLDKGHYYKEKTRYIDRILSVSYRIRPIIDNKRLSFLDELQETGASFVGNFDFCNPDAILGANHYFGAFLREKGMSVQELENWIRICRSSDFFDFAKFLDVSVKELSSLFEDIKRADGLFNNGKWKSRLLNFTAIVAPKYGPAANRNSLQQWRDYAGARFLVKQAYNDAKKKGRRPTLDERFPWKTMPYSKGWEIKLGDSFDSNGSFEKFLAAFMMVHNEREKNDWAAYNRLLSDYIGVNKNGMIHDSGNRKCLRSVMLGYLKTFEVVQGGSCMSCNVCVPNEKFEIDLDKRSQVVVKLDESIATFLEKIENDWKFLPHGAEIEKFWKMVQKEMDAGRSTLGYIEGVTGRMLDDNPAHIPAIYIRLTGMASSQMYMDKHAFIENSRTLVTNCSVEDLSIFFDEFLQNANEIIPDDPNILEVQAIALNRLEKYQKEFNLRADIHSNKQTTEDLFLSNAKALCDLTKPGGSIKNQKSYLKYVLALARCEKSGNDIRQYYRILIAEWSWEELEKELFWLEKHSKFKEMRQFLLNSWLAEEKSPQNSLEVYRFFENKKLIQGWDELWESKLFLVLDFDIFEQFPEMMHNYWKAIENGRFKPVKRLYLYIFSEMIRQQQAMISAKHVDIFVKMFLEETNQEERRNFLEENIATDSQFIPKLYKYINLDVLPNKSETFSSWLSIFSPYLDVQSFKITQKITIKVLDLGATSVSNLMKGFPDFFEGITIPLLSNKATKDHFHQLWMEYIRKYDYSEISLFYFKCLIKSYPIQNAHLDDITEVILSRKNTKSDKTLQMLRRIVPFDSRLNGSILSALFEFQDLLNELKKETVVEAFDKITAEHLQEINSIFQPAVSELRANMTVSLLVSLRKLLNQSWLSPVAYIVEALCCAGRYEEAKQMSIKYPDLKIGRFRLSFDSFLKKQLEIIPEEKPKTQLIEKLEKYGVEEVSTWKIAQNRARFGR
jgi:superfamily II DNA helicase RecQ